MSAQRACLDIGHGKNGAGVSESSSVESLWAAFAAARPDIAGSGATYQAWHFCDNAADADELAELVCLGRKRATAGALWSYEDEKEPLPKAGDLAIVTDWAGRARCVVRSSSVEVVPFEAVTDDFAATEGEGDGSLAYWRKEHWEAFSRGLAETGRVPDLRMPVVCERFDVVFVADPVVAQG